MTPKEEADRLYWLYYDQIEQHLLTGIDHQISILCAVIAVQEIINTIPYQLNHWQEVLTILKAMK